MRLEDMVLQVRSKNAGPFWVSIDVFCGSDATFEKLCTSLSTRAVAAALKVEADKIRRFEIGSLKVIKFSFPRALAQGNRFDRDMHGAQYGHILAELQLPA